MKKWGFSIDPLDDGRTFEITEDCVVYGIKIPKGFQYDGASTPRLFWRVAPPVAGKHHRASLVHDYLYKHKLGTRAIADKLFLEIMLVDKVNKIKAHSMYRAVRIGGSRSWRRLTPLQGK